MANIKYSDLLYEVLPSLTGGAPDPTIEQAIKRTVIDFCSRSWVWKYLAEPIDVLAGVSAYDLEPEASSDITMVMNVAYDGSNLTNKSTDWLDQNTPGWRTVQETPRYFTQVDTEQIILAGVPNSTLRGALLVTAALQPSYTSKDFPKWIFNQHQSALTDGALYRLMLIPGKPWTDLQTGADRRSTFEAAIGNARSSAVMGLGRAATRTTAQH